VVEPLNLYKILRDKFETRLDQPFLVSPGGSQHSYGDIDRLSAEFAATLIEVGVNAGDRVVVQVDKSPPAVALYLACLRIGAVYVPLNTAYTSAEVAYFLGDAVPALFVCRPDPVEQLSAIAKQAGVATTLTLGDSLDGSFADMAQKLSPLNELTMLDPDDVAAMLYTSGTTGRSKGAMLTLDNLASNAITLHEYWGFRPGDVLLHALPIFHVHGLFVALHCAMLNASKVIFLPKFDTAEVRKLLTDATLMMGVPTFYTRLLDCEDFGREECRHIRLFISGSAPLTEQTFEAFEQRTGHKILERYGMTETSMITSNPLNGERVAGTVGYALPGIEIRVADGTGTPLPPGTVGSVELKGPNVFKGYWQMPEKTAQEFHADGFFITGDLGSLAEDGRLSLVGRSKDLIISGGYNIYPKEIEVIIDEVPGVLESAVIGIPHSDLGESVVAVVVPDKENPATEESISKVTGSQLAVFKQPRRIILVDELPRNTMGKVQKNILRDRYPS
jgi:malonyl-CoA/methylmalonyl-CoA synthetase